MKIKRTYFLFFVSFVLFTVPNRTYAQFWGGFLQGVGAALQNFNNQQRYDNYQSKQNYVRKSPVEKYEIQKKSKVESDGFEWIQVKTWNGHDFINYGALNSDGKSIIPQKYSMIYYHITDGGWFCVSLNEKEGVYDTEGRCICEPIYDDVYYNKVKSGVYVEVKINGKTGIVDEWGQYIVQPNIKYNDFLSYSEARGTFYYKNSMGDYEDLGIDIKGNKRNNDTYVFPFTSSIEHKILKTYIGDESRDFDGKGHVVIGKDALVINLGLIVQEYKYIGEPKQIPGYKVWTVEADSDGTKGKINFADLGKEIMIQPSGYNMPIGYIVEQ